MLIGVEVRLRGALPSPSEAHDAGQRLGKRLVMRHALDGCRVTVNANKRRVLAWRLEPFPELFVHWSLAPWADDVLAVLDGDRQAWVRLRDRLPAHDPDDAPTDTRPRGRVHALDELLVTQRAWLPRAPEVPVTWGRWPRTVPRRTLRLGSCTTSGSPLIRIHPVLDHEEVPDWFVGFVLFHELLHVVFPPLTGSARRVVHPRSFRMAERRHPDHARALAWEKKHVHSLVRRCAEQVSG